MLTEKYRPKKLGEIVGQKHIVNSLKQWIQKGEFPHALFVGPPGCGKTSTAHAFANELGIPIIEYNASDERGIQTIREKVKRLAMTVGKKIILLDEADSMTEDAQHALRRIMERCSKDVKFILTANEEWKIIDPIKSRCAIFYFNKLSDEQVLGVLINILKEEKIIIRNTKKVRDALLLLVKYVDGDLRKALNILETMINSGKELTPDNVQLFIPGVGEKILKMALDGNWSEALSLLEDLYIKNRLDVNLTINELYKAIAHIGDELIRAKLYMKLAEVEHAIKIGGSPLIQLSAFLACVYACKYARR
ncbi:MAG TPA: AAA family ATPase [Candidatus Bathyarchaeota archaeon]|nr:AAA family ATPase [Candidatus Bathyarchaeota archaeon]